MSFFTFSFLIYLVVLLIPYFHLPERARILWLYAMNLIFIYLVGGWSMFGWLLGSILVTYIGGLVIAGTKHRKAWFVCFTVLEVGCLAFLKLQNFAVSNINLLRGALGQSADIQPMSIVVPLGISFFMLQFISYLSDVYTKKYEPTRDFMLFATYGTFFPQVMSGPINRWDSMQQQFLGKKAWDWERILPALERIAWGFFKKLVIAERLSLVVNASFSNYHELSGFNALIGALACTLQLYADFSGYSDIAFGVAKLLDIEIIDNFKTPYFSTSVQEFWRRWHISLSTWLKDYVYIPLGGSRCSKGRRYFNLMVTFLVSGIWHGAGWNYIWWGLLHGFAQMVGNITKPIRVKSDGVVIRVLRTIGTFFIVMLLWVLFFAPTAKDGFLMIGKIFQIWNYQFAPDLNYHYVNYAPIIWLLLGVSLIVMVVVDFIAHKADGLVEALKKLPWPIHLLILWYMIGAITLSLNLSTSEFIYMQF